MNYFCANEGILPVGALSVIYLLYTNTKMQTLTYDKHPVIMIIINTDTESNNRDPENLNSSKVCGS